MEKKLQQFSSKTSEQVERRSNYKLRAQEKLDSQMVRHTLPMGGHSNLYYDHTGSKSERPHDVVFYNQSLRNTEPGNETHRFNTNIQSNTKRQTANKLPTGKNSNTIFHNILSDKQYLLTSPVQSQSKHSATDLDFPAPRVSYKETKQPVPNKSENYLSSNLNARAIESKDNKLYERRVKNIGSLCNVRSPNFSIDTNKLAFSEKKFPNRTYSN